MRLYQPEFLEVARKGGLSHAEFLRGQPAAQLFLISNPLIGHQAEDLTVTKSLVRVHGCRRALGPCIFIHAAAYSCQWNSQTFRAWRPSNGAGRGAASHVRFVLPARCTLDFPRRGCNLSFSAIGLMGTSCQIAGCKNDTPPALAERRFCVLHFTLTLETSCSEM